MKVPMQIQKVQKRDSLQRPYRPLRPVPAWAESAGEAYRVLETTLVSRLEDNPFQVLPFGLALLAFIVLLGLLSPALTPSRDFRLPGDVMELPQDVKLPHLLLNSPDLGTLLVQDSAEVTIAEAVSSEKIPPLETQDYVLKKGDMISAIANKYNLNLGTIISFNNIRNVRHVGVGTTLVIPNSVGVLYTVKKGDSLSGISRTWKIAYETVLEANRLTTPVLAPGQKVFLPGANLSARDLREALGELFILPTNGVITSRFGTRRDPFTGVRTFHNGVDFANAMGTPVRAAMEGRVTDTGFNSSYGNYVLVSHEGGFQTLYGHLKKFLVSDGQYVSQGQQVGLMGNTGYSTGTHLHFSIFKWNNPLNPLNYLY
jgi:murein DD-endopeptidase MepM/ murein hydrolase activator NlpD